MIAKKSAMQEAVEREAKKKKRKVQIRHEPKNSRSCKESVQASKEIGKANENSQAHMQKM